MEHRGVQIVDVHRLVHGTETKLIRCTMGVATARASASEPTGEAIVIVVAPIELWILRDGGAAEFATPQNECTFQKATLAKIGEECRQWLIPFPGELAVVFLKAVVVVPRLAIATPHLDKPHAPFKQPTRH